MFKMIVFIIILGIIGVVSISDLRAADDDPYNADTNKESEYVMGPGDQLEVSVWNHPEFTRTIRIRPDGKISLPLINNMRASGVTPSALSKIISDQLVKYIKDPQVSVIVAEYRSKNILVIGNVIKPGLYQYEGNMTVFDAIGMAEGYKPHAQLKSILVVRGAYDNDPRYYIANLYKAIHDGDLRDNVGLQPKDIVYVPKNFIGNAADFADFYITRIQPVATSYYFYKETTD
ncbi:MAG: polysaccharide biosynthesis/export family protein [Candidatus Omnitrophica bacterium]|nr:polysaccharide biosynthesis/export family protein [Candidatus Omnitrophota bacterium]